MIKGARKEMIVVRTGGSRYFDEAYFVLREDAQREKRKSKNILEEANRILAEISPELSPTVHKRPRGWFFFVAGSICGAILGVIVMIPVV